MPNDFGLRKYIQQNYHAAYSEHVILGLWLKFRSGKQSSYYGRYSGYAFAKHGWLASKVAKRPDPVDEQPPALDYVAVLQAAEAREVLRDGES